MERPNPKDYSVGLYGIVRYRRELEKYIDYLEKKLNQLDKRDEEF